MKLPQSPSGLTGKLFGKLMEWTNADAYHKALQALAPSDNEQFLEIGFGTGRCAEMLLLTTASTFVAGIDSTETMVKTASNRLIKKGLGDRIDLRQGTDELLPWDNHQFDAIVAIHSFQFWQDPDRSMREIDRVLRSHGRIIIVFRDLLDDSDIGEWRQRSTLPFLPIGSCRDNYRSIVKSIAR
jgi:ubiquinone/menaquinone biosynthesis C-methylase UbiE